VTGTQILVIAIPIALIEFGLLLFAVYDLFQEDRRVKGDNKIIWALIIVFVNIIGPLVYFFFGRDEGRGGGAAAAEAPSAAVSAVLATWPRLATGASAAIETRGLTKRYGRIVALDGLDLTVPSGSVFGFLGPNGAGKTTTLRLLSGLARASGGSGTVAGIAIGGTGGELARNIGYLDQDPRFYGWMKGRELLELVGRLHGLNGRGLRQRVGDVLEIVSLSQAAGRKIGGYSGGMRQRLGIGQALLNRPRVLFLDEPVSSLDPEGRRDILDIIDRLRGIATVFMSTHILNDVERVCDRVAILNVGHLVVEGPIDELLDRYAQPIYELQPEPHQPGAIDRLSDAIRLEPWASDVRATPDTVRVFVSDPKQAGPALLPLIAQTGVELVRFERARPSLEDVFMRLVAERPEVLTTPTIEIPVTGLDGRGRG
jgi:ABC-2 type transport system ATP-binding protein